MQYNDQPIRKPNQDLFGRAPFALSLARSIDRLSAHDGFIIAIHGEWGTGKTSVLHLIERYLRHLEMERASHKQIYWGKSPSPRDLRQLDEMADVFEPIEAYAKELEALNQDLTKCARDACWQEFRRRLPTDTDADVADYYWQLKCHIDAHPRTIIVRFSPWLISGRAELASALFSDLARALGAKLGDDVKQAFAALLKRLSEFAPVAGAGLDVVTPGAGLGKYVRSGGDWAGRVASQMASGPTLDSIRGELKRTLSRLRDRKVLVILDDLDRLTPPEALEIVSVVKSLGDLPNVIYLLSYSERTLEKLISRAIGLSGREYLEKIVQYGVHLPRLDSDDLERLLFSDLDHLLGDLSIDDQNRLGFVWTNILQTYFRTPRDIRRFVNALAVTRPGLGDFTDPIDLCILECLRLCEPDIYSFIRNNLFQLTE